MWSAERVVRERIRRLREVWLRRSLKVHGEGVANAAVLINMLIRRFNTRTSCSSYVWPSGAARRNIEPTYGVMFSDVNSSTCMIASFSTSRFLPIAFAALVWASPAMARSVVFVDNARPRQGDGNAETPATTLAAAQRASRPNDIIFVAEGLDQLVEHIGGIYSSSLSQFLRSAFSKDSARATPESLRRSDSPSFRWPTPAGGRVGELRLQVVKALVDGRVRHLHSTRRIGFARSVTTKSTSRPSTSRK